MCDGERRGEGEGGRLQGGVHGGGREGTAGKVVDMHAVSPAAKPEGL